MSNIKDLEKDMVSIIPSLDPEILRRHYEAIIMSPFSLGVYECIKNVDKPTTTPKRKYKVE